MQASAGLFGWRGRLGRSIVHVCALTAARTRSRWERCARGSYALEAAVKTGLARCRRIQPTDPVKLLAEYPHKYAEGGWVDDEDDAADAEDTRQVRGLTDHPDLADDAQELRRAWVIVELLRGEWSFVRSLELLEACCANPLKIQIEAQAEMRSKLKPGVVFIEDKMTLLPPIDEFNTVFKPVLALKASAGAKLLGRQGATLALFPCVLIGASRGGICLCRLSMSSSWTRLSCG